MGVRERFAVLMAQAPEAISLDEAALLVAAEEYPGLDVAAHQDRLDEMARAVAARLRRELEPHRLAQLLSDHLFGHLGFRGNVGDYYDPRNSFLNEVLDRRVGIPITLSILYVAVGGRLGLPLSGVSFPGHFIVVYRAAPEPFFLDAFNEGWLLTESDFRLLTLEQFGPAAALDPAVLRPATPHETIARLLRNLKHVYVTREDFPRAVRCSERILLVLPAAEERRDLGLLLARAGQLRDAVPHLERYLAEAPEAPDRARIQAHLIRLQLQMRRLN
ncbi:MAG: SirB1 family protein [Candidatus Rokuibacteriota bacterium]